MMRGGLFGNGIVSDGAFLICTSRVRGEGSFGFVIVVRFACRWIGDFCVRYIWGWGGDYIFYLRYQLSPGFAGFEVWTE